MKQAVPTGASSSAIMTGHGNITDVDSTSRSPMHTGPLLRDSSNHRHKSIERDNKESPGLVKLRPIVAPPHHLHGSGYTPVGSHLAERRD